MRRRVYVLFGFMFIILYLFVNDVVSGDFQKKTQPESAIPSVQHTENYHLSDIDEFSIIWWTRLFDMIKRNPEKAADKLIKTLSKMDEDKRVRFINTRIEPMLGILLDKLDSIPEPDRFTVLFNIVVDAYIKEGKGVDISKFENLYPIASEILQEKIEEYNKNLKTVSARFSKAISTNTLNYNIPLNDFIEVSRIMRIKPTKMKEIVENISIKNSSNTLVQNTISYMFIQEKDYKEAERYATKSIEVQPKDYDAYILRAQARYSLKDIKGAMEDVKKASEINPSDETARLLATYFTQKAESNSKNAVIVKDSILSNILSNSDFEGNNSLKSYEDKDEVSINYDTKFLTDDAKRSNYYLKMAQIKTEMKDYSEALKLVNKAIERDPTNIDAYIERANIYNLMGNYSDAISDATTVLRHDPNNIFALNIRAWALFKKGLIEEAESDTSKAIDIKPNFADAMFLRALIYEKQSRYDDMLKELEKASKLNPLYVSYFRDAMLNYSNRVANFMNYYEKNKGIFENQEVESNMFDVKRFLILLGFTIVGGIIIGIIMLHIFSPKITKVQTTNHTTATKEFITPNVFYEGVASGKYKIIRKLGQGGMGSVYLAVDQTLQRQVALKKMNEDIKMNEREKQRFLEEARTVAMLHHPNIIEIYTIFEENGDIYLVFEYIDGISLDKKLDMEIRMPFFEVKDIVIEVAKALRYAHSKNIVHRDLKLSNIMISNDGIVKVMDFGLAKVLSQVQAKYSSSEVVGSPAYMAPEQDLGIFLKESDLYSLGVCIYEMLVGELPFAGPDYHYQKERKLYTPLTQIVAGIPKDIDRVISKLLEPEPQLRYHSVDEFLLDFEKLA